MPLTPAEVLRLSRAARLGIDMAEATELARTLEPVLAQMDAMLLVNVEGVAPVDGVGAAGMPLRPDAGPPLPLAVSPDRFAPEWREGLFLLPPVVLELPPGDGAA